MAFVQQFDPINIYAIELARMRTLNFKIETSESPPIARVMSPKTGEGGYLKIFTIDTSYAENLDFFIIDAQSDDGKKARITIPASVMDAIASTWVDFDRTFDPSAYRFELKNLKTAGYDDSLRFEASLYLNGAKIGTASDDGNGGSHRVDILNLDDRKAFNRYVNHFKAVQLDPQKDWMHYWLYTWLRHSELPEVRLNQSDICQDVVIDGLIEAYEWRRKLRSKRYAEKTVIATLASDQLYTFHVKYSDSELIAARCLATLIEQNQMPIESTTKDIVVFNQLLT